MKRQMRGNTDPSAQAQRRRDAWHSAWLSSVLLLLSALLLLGLRWYYGLGGFWGALVGIGAISELLAIVPIWFLLKVRLKEIEGGEEDAAAQY